MENNKEFNIGFEISTILAASGCFGDKSGVYRLNFNLIKYLSQYLIDHNLNHQIYLYTLNPALKYNVSLDLYELLSKKNIHYIDIEYKVGKLLQDFSIFNIRGVRFLVKKVDSFFYQTFLTNTIFTNYVRNLTKKLKEKKVSIVHHSESGFTQLNGIKSIIHINDLIPVKFPFWQRKDTIEIHKRKLQFASNHCEGVICISHNTKKDYLEFLKDHHLIAPKIKVIHLAAEKFKRSPHASLNQINHVISQQGYQSVTRQKYFFYFGTIEPRKNITLLITIFDSLYRQNQLGNFKLVMMGGKGWGRVYENIANYIKENYPLKTTSPIILLDFMADEYLATLIENAYSVIYPSIYEGFGLPIIESLNMGTPVISSNSSSLPEVGGKACLYINPSEPDSLKKAIISIIESPKLRQELAKKSVDQSKKFSWEKVAEQTYKFYCQILN